MAEERGSGDHEALRERVRERMKAEGIPAGTDDPLLLALGAKPLDGEQRAVCSACGEHVGPGTSRRNIDGKCLACTIDGAPPIARDGAS